MVEWMPTGDRRAPILSYSIQYNTSFTPDVWEDAFVNIPAPDNRFRVSMSPWSNYTFRVIGRNKIGPSLPSEPSDRCSTEEDVPHKNPEKVVGRGSSPRNLEITWTPMPMIEHNAPGFFYKVYWKRNDDPGSRWESRTIDDWQRNRLVVDNQPTFKPYRIKVEAHNRRGQAHMIATEVIGYSGEDRPTQPPRAFRLLEVRDSRSALFRWDPVPPNTINGHFKGYKIQTWTDDEGEEARREVIVQSNVTSALATIFRPFSKNIVQVVAFNEMYNGPPSERIEVITPEGTPGPVTFFDAVPMGSSSFYLKWSKPQEINGILKGYRIYYEEVHGTQLGPKLEKKPPINDPLATRTNWLASNLLPSTGLPFMLPLPRDRVILTSLKNLLVVTMMLSLMFLPCNGSNFPMKKENLGSVSLGSPLWIQTNLDPIFMFSTEGRVRMDSFDEILICFMLFPLTLSLVNCSPLFHFLFLCHFLSLSLSFSLLFLCHFLSLSLSFSPEIVWFSGETQFESTPEEEDNDYILVRGLDPQAIYEFRVVAVDGKHATPSKLEEINTRNYGTSRECYSSPSFRVL